MNGTFTLLAFAMAGLGVTPPEHIPPAPVSTAAYQSLDCGQLIQAAEVVDGDLARAWDRQETLLRHRFGAPAPVVRRSEMQVAQLKGELEAIWQVADRKACGDAPESTDLAWAHGREPGPMLGEPREWPGPRDQGDEPYRGDAGADDEPFEPAYADPEQADADLPEESYGEQRDWVEGAPEDEARQFEGYDEPAPPGPAAWPDSPPPPVDQRRVDPNGDIEWPAPQARPTAPVQQSDLPSTRRL